MRGKTSIVNDSGGLVLEERKITVSDEKLKTILMRLYERSRKDATKFQWYEMYQVCWSIFFTLVLTLATTGVSDFKAPFSDKILMAESTVEMMCWVVAFVLFVFGLVCVFWRMKSKVNDQNSERDVAVSDCLMQHCGHSSLPDSHTL